MNKLLLLIALCAVFAATILAGPGVAARHLPKAPTVPVVTTDDSGTTVVPAVKGSGGGRFRM